MKKKKEFSIDYPELDGTINLCKDISQTKIKFTEEEWVALNNKTSKDAKDTSFDNKSLGEKYDEYKNWLNGVISDEEIESYAMEYTFEMYGKRMLDYEQYDTYSDFVNGAKWFRTLLEIKPGINNNFP